MTKVGKKPKPKTRRPLTRQVYFVQAAALKLIKIGVANHALTRIAGLQTGSPDPLVLLGYIDVENAPGFEAALHVEFADLREHGEWFRPEPRLLAFIERIDRQAREERQGRTRQKLHLLEGDGPNDPLPDIEGALALRAASA